MRSPRDSSDLWLALYGSLQKNFSLQSVVLFLWYSPQIHGIEIGRKESLPERGRKHKTKRSFPWRLCTAVMLVQEQMWMGLILGQDSGFLAHPLSAPKGALNPQAFPWAPCSLPRCFPDPLHFVSFSNHKLEHLFILWAPSWPPRQSCHSASMLPENFICTSIGPYLTVIIMIIATTISGYLQGTMHRAKQFELFRCVCSLVLWDPGRKGPCLMQLSPLGPVANTVLDL